MATYVPYRGKYTGKPCTLIAVLGEYGDMGFTLHQIERDIVELHYKDSLIQNFSQCEATVEAIREACQERLDRLNEIEAS